MAHAQKPDFVFFRHNGQVHLNRRGRQYNRLLADELCTLACRVCTARASLCSAVMWRLLVTHSILLFHLHFSRASPCAITNYPYSSLLAPPCGIKRNCNWQYLYYLLSITVLCCTSIVVCGTIIFTVFWFTLHHIILKPYVIWCRFFFKRMNVLVVSAGFVLSLPVC
jgi:hypothetical protein